ncbi:MAG: hypothetical protein WDZ85_04005 [Candidatus Paceibacterota bacterium]
MLILLFPLIAGTLMVLLGFLLLWRDWPAVLTKRIRRLPFKFFGLFWFILAVGVWLASTYTVRSLVLYAGAVLMFIDAMTLMAAPTVFLRQAFRWYGRQNIWYSLAYAFFLIIIGSLIISDIWPLLDLF